MKIDLNKYVLNRPFIQNYYRNHKNDDIGQMISIWAATTHCPCIVLAHYLAEEVGYTEELINIIDRLTRNYGYTEIQGQIDSSPYLTSNKNSDIKD